MRIGIGLPGPFWVSGSVGGAASWFRLLFWAPILLLAFLTFLAALAGAALGVVVYGAVRTVAILRHQRWRHSWGYGLAWSAYQGCLLGIALFITYFLIGIGAWWMIPILTLIIVLAVRRSRKRAFIRAREQAQAQLDYERRLHDRAREQAEQDRREAMLQVEEAAEWLRFCLDQELPISVGMRHHLEEWLRSDLSPSDRVAYLMRLFRGDLPEDVYWYITVRLGHSVRATRQVAAGYAI
jgi:hypothetical protein